MGPAERPAGASSIGPVPGWYDSRGTSRSCSITVARYSASPLDGFSNSGNLGPRQPRDYLPSPHL